MVLCTALNYLTSLNFIPMRGNHSKILFKFNDIRTEWFLIRLCLDCMKSVVHTQRWLIYLTLLDSEYVCIKLSTNVQFCAQIDKLYFWSICKNQTYSINENKIQTIFGAWFFFIFFRVLLGHIMYVLLYVHIMYVLLVIVTPLWHL